LVLAAVVGVIFWQFSGGMVEERLIGTFDQHENVASAYASSQLRQDLFWRSIDVTKAHPLFGVGPGNFQIISGSWHVSHNSFTQMSSEGGIPALILYVLILWCSFKNVRSARRLTRGQGELGLLSRAIFASDAYQFFPYFIVAFTVLLYRFIKQSVSTTKENNAAREATRESEPDADKAGSQLSWHFS
jgi:O-antigen ligase